ncbi:zf-HC2 domain-containing protein [Paenibacillus eucommiae]|uniref:Anti-sigma-W factor RsiW n=1 Tax=Paenibacillus eucommiae TaxID=1355755 RepID=A0ABS4JCM5_9BACL|nr:zf-HC2 domain-containing protein [Paenibacillus eucommiae]MBP1996821.1 anti-sigma factor RsiW [Paenibacillus eucommiae]
MNCKEALPLMHDYLDGDLSQPEALKLKEHFVQCTNCRTLFKELERTDAMVRSLPPTSVPDDLTERIMGGLPVVKKRNSWLQWVRKHPAASVAVVFLALMFGSFMAMWNQDGELMVKGTDLQDVIIQGDTVIVPEGHTVNGNLVVKSGKLQVNGDVTGNLIVIDGSLNLASTAHIYGQITKVDEVMGWFWYKINTFLEQFSE